MTNTAGMATPALALDGVAKSFDGGKTLAAANVCLTIGYGEFVVLVGESGSGKTTTLKMLNRLIEPDAGEIRMGGRSTQDIPGHELRRHIGYAFQGVGLFPHLSVGDNVAVTPQLLGWPQDKIRARVDELLDLVDLPAAVYAARAPASLSGGQKQRVGFARALAAKPHIVLLDEPFGALDPLTRTALAQAYRRLHERLELTTIMVTHDLTEALLLADRLGVMQAGRLVALGAPADLIAGAGNDYVRRLLDTPRLEARRIAQTFGDWPQHG